jgi:hypothetical protein
MLVAEGTASLLDTIGSTLTQVIAWIGQVVTAITSGALAPLLPVLCIAIGVSAVLLVIKIVRKMCWGA